MSWVSEIKDICGDYYIDIKYHENQKEAISLFFNSHRNAETVKRCIELDDSVPNVATAVDFVEVVRCKDCKYRGDFSCPMCYEEKIDYDDDGYFETDYILHDRTTDNGFCDYGEKDLKEREMG